jgi:hypothetical protein
MKPGWKSTEFVTASGVAVVVASYGVEDPDPGVRMVALAGLSLVACCYAIARTFAKSGGEA